MYNFDNLDKWNDEVQAEVEKDIAGILDCLSEEQICWLGNALDCIDGFFKQEVGKRHEFLRPEDFVAGPAVLLHIERESGTAFCGFGEVPFSGDFDMCPECIDAQDAFHKTNILGKLTSEEKEFLVYNTHQFEDEGILGKKRKNIDTSEC